MIFTVCVLAGTVRDLIMDKKMAKTKTKAQLAEEKAKKMNAGVIKYKMMAEFDDNGLGEISDLDVESIDPWGV